MKETSKPRDSVPLMKPHESAEMICDKIFEKKEEVPKEMHHGMHHGMHHEHKEHRKCGEKEWHNKPHCRRPEGAFNESMKFYDAMSSFLTQEVTKMSESKLGFGTNIENLNKLIDVQLRIDDAKKKILKCDQ